MIEWFDQTLRDSKGEKIGLLAIGRDITESEQIEAELRENRDRLQALVDQAPDGIFVADLDGRYTDVNEAGCRMLGFERHEIVGKTILDLIPPEQAERLDASKSRLQGGSIEIEEWSLLHKDGSYLPVEVSARVLPDGRWQGFVRDISQRQETERELQQVMHALGERVKELRCLYDLTSLVESGIGSVDQYLQLAVKLLPQGWQYPDITVARILFQGQEYRTENFHPSMWALAAPIKVQNREVGRVDVCYLEQRPEADQGPFLAEEISLIEAVAGHLGSTLMQMEVERQLRESEIRFRNAFGNAVFGMALVAPEGRFLQVNDSLCGIVGYSEQALLAKTFQDITHPDDLETDLASLERLRAGTISYYQLEKRYIHQAGHIVWVRISVSAVRHSGGDVQYYVVQIEDIGERKELEDRLRQSQEQLELIQENAPDFIFQISRDAAITYANRMPPGITAADILGSNLQQWLRPEEEEAFEVAMQLVFEKQEETDYEAVGAVTGAVFSVRIKPVIDNGKVDCAVLVAHDITERRKLTLELEESRERFAGIFMAANEGIAIHELVLDQFGEAQDYRITDVNPAYETILGISRGEALGSLASELYGTGKPPYLDIYARVAITGVSNSFEAYFQPKDSYFFIASFALGENRFATMFVDISERKRSEEQIRLHQEKLERFNKLAVGRELAMIDLKKEINALRHELGLDDKYAVHEPSRPQDG